MPGYRSRTLGILTPVQPIPWVRTWQQNLFEEPSSLDGLTDVPLAFLLGPPGSGKSTTVELYCANADSSARLVLFSEVRSQQDVLTQLEAAFAVDQTLFLDAYDEASELNPRSLRLAIQQARNAGRLPKVRIVSRLARIDDQTIQDIAEAYFGEADTSSPFRPHSLQPLTSDQVHQYVERWVSPDQRQAFWREIERHGIGPSLVWPADLRSFVVVFNADGHLGDSRAAAWSRSVEIQLDEPNPLRGADGSKPSRFGTTDRLTATKFLAAADVLCRKFPLVLEGESSKRLSPRLLYSAELNSLPQGVETEADYHVLLREVTDTRVFETHGGVATFSSAAVAQFLAAEYLRGLPLETILNLLTEAFEGKRIPDAAAPIAAELARFDQGVFNHLCEAQPDIFCTSVLREYSPEQRAQIVEAFFLRREQRHHYGRGYQNPELIGHDGLATQLVPYLTSAEADEDDLNLAIDMAEYCQVEELATELGALANDKSRTLQARANAAHAILRLPSGHHALLRPLLKLCKREDPYDELYGCAMLALWPDAFTPAEALKLLRKPRDPDTTGMYQGFLHYGEDGAAFRLTESHVLPGLKWLEKQEQGREDDRREYEDLSLVRQRLTALAWDGLYEPGVAEGLAKVTLARQRRFYDILSFRKEAEEEESASIYSRPKKRPQRLTPDEFLADRGKRMYLFDAWLNELDANSDDFRDTVYFVDGRGEEGTEADLEYLLATVPPNEFKKKAVRYLLDFIAGRMIYIGRKERLEPFRDVLRRWEVDLEEVETELNRVRRQVEGRPRPAVRNGFTIEKALAEIRSIIGGSDTIKLYNALARLNVAPDGYDHQYETPEASPLWTTLTESEHADLMAMAKAYVIEIPSKYPPIVSPRLRYSPALSVAVWLLKWLSVTDYEWCKADLQNITAALRSTFLLPNNGRDATLQIQSLMLMVPADQRADWFLGNCRSRGKKLDLGWVGREPDIWSQDLAEEFARRIALPELPENLRFNMLGTLAAQKSPLAVGALESELRIPKSRRKGRAVEIILRFYVDGAYISLSNVAESDQTVYDHVWRCLWNNRRVDTPGALGDFSTSLLKRLYLQACRSQPPDEDEPPFRGARPVTEKMRRHHMRDALYKALKEKNEEDTWEWLRAQASQPGFEWITDSVRDQRNQWLEEQWIPPDPAVLARLKASSSASRVVKTDDELLAVVLEQLRQIRTEIESNPLFSKGREPEVTAVVARFLDKALKECIVNCEADAKPVGKRRTDIQIEAVVAGVGKKLKCVIETKFCDNVDVASDIGKLRTEYLHASESATGVYLVYRLPGCDCAKCRSWAQVEEALVSEADRSGQSVKVISWELSGEPRTRKKGKST